VIITEGKTKVFHSDKKVARHTLVMARDGKIIPPDDVAIGDSEKMSEVFASFFAGFVVACQAKPKDPNGLVSYDVTVMVSGVVLMPCVPGVYLYGVPVTVAVLDGRIRTDKVAQAGKTDQIGLCRCNNTNPTQIDLELFDNTPAKKVMVKDGFVLEEAEGQAPKIPDSPKPLPIISEEEFNKLSQ